MTKNLGFALEAAVSGAGSSHVTLMNGLAAPRQADVDQATTPFSRVKGGPSRPRATDGK